jgi:endoglucanase
VRRDAAVHKSLPERASVVRPALLVLAVIVLGASGVVYAQDHLGDRGRGIASNVTPDNSKLSGTATPSAASSSAAPTSEPATPPASEPPVTYPVSQPSSPAPSNPHEVHSTPRPLASHAPASQSTIVDASPGPTVRAPAGSAGPDVFGDATLYVDPQSTAVAALQQDQAAGTPTASPAPTASPTAGGDSADPQGNAAAIAKIAGTAQVRWFTEAVPVGSVAAQITSYLAGAAASHALPTLVLNAIPFIDCATKVARGLPRATEYAAWIRQAAIGLHGAVAGVILEPGALTSTGCLSAAERATRFAMLADAVSVLTSNSRLGVYIDGGTSRSLSAAELAARLTSVGVSKASGFSLNVANFYTTRDEESFGEAVAALLGGSHYVVDTGRNGNGPAPDSPLSACNPSGRALGHQPTDRTAGAHDDAYLWIKHPGESDGACRTGEPAVGNWFESYALGLVSNAAVV